MKLSDNFSLIEFTKSQTAERKGIENKPNEIHTIAMEALCHNILERVRSAFGKPVMINSGYRSPALCEAIGSKPTSQHCFAEAVDCEMFKSPGNRPVFEWFVNESGLSWDQIILEFEGEDPFDGWLHISSKRCLSENRKEVLRAVRQDGKTVYLPGIN